ncbi:hypothetical protein R1flu_016022 [Riccia fluitans]|uniref:Uncharacterized protein n=1 Tax=Riccia fluitans TaxID=41844 RepID=A0ABD1YKM2_9MARC
MGADTSMLLPFWGCDLVQDQDLVISLVGKFLVRVDRQLLDQMIQRLRSHVMQRFYTLRPAESKRLGFLMVRHIM